jgi:alkyl hydroperoxide reductase subunit AhpF
MTIIAEKDRATVKDVLARELVDDVELLLFTYDRSDRAFPGGMVGETGEETRELLEDLTALSDRLHLTTYDVGVDRAVATRYNVSAVPTVMIRPASAAGSEAGANVRFLGLPGGYEFSTLVADILDVSKGRTGLSAETREAVKAIETPVHIQVFVTPT